jgi:drug/metabolite transporter (DMT)-like permease
MTLPPPPAADEVKAGFLSADRAEQEETVFNALTPTPSLEGPQKPKSLSFSNGGFLSAPLTGPVRPLSPDTISNLSIDEYEQIRPGRLSRQLDGDGRRISDSPAPPRGFRGKLQQFWIRNKGLAFMLLGQVFGTLMNVTTRLLEIEGNKGKGLHPFQILFARMGITFILASTYMWYQKTPHFPFGMKDVRWLLIARGLGGFAGVFGMYYSLLYLPLADATVITFLAPSLACWACSILINEPFTRTEKFAGLVSLVGVILIARPTSLFSALTGSASSPSDGDLATGNPDAAPSNGTTPADASNYDDVTPSQRLSAVGIALIGVIGSATAYTTIRWIGKRAHPLISVNYFAFGCFIVSVVMQSVLPGVGFLLPAGK